MERGGEDTLRLDNEARRGIQHHPLPKRHHRFHTSIIRTPCTPMKVRKEGRPPKKWLAFTSLKGNEGRAPSTTGILSRKTRGEKRRR